jgi:hypothetical protein
MSSPLELAKEWGRYFILMFIGALLLFFTIIFIVPISFFILYKRYKEQKEREVYGHI